MGGFDDEIAEAKAEQERRRLEAEERSRQSSAEDSIRQHQADEFDAFLAECLAALKRSGDRFRSEVVFDASRNKLANGRPVHLWHLYTEVNDDDADVRFYIDEGLAIFRETRWPDKAQRFSSPQYWPTRFVLDSIIKDPDPDRRHRRYYCAEALRKVIAADLVRRGLV